MIPSQLTMDKIVTANLLQRNLIAFLSDFYSAPPNQPKFLTLQVNTHIYFLK